MYMRVGVCVCLPGDEDAEQVELVGPGQQHSQAESQLQQEQPAHHQVNTVALAQRQEVHVVQVGGDVGDP